MVEVVIASVRVRGVIALVWGEGVRVRGVAVSGES